MTATVMQNNVVCNSVSVLSGINDQIRCVCCSFVGAWDNVEKHVHEKHREMSVLRGNEFRIGGAQQLDMSAMLFTTQHQLYSCFVQELTGAGRSVFIYKDHVTNGQCARAILRHTSELHCAANRTYQLEWNRWITIPMKDLDRFADSRNYEICLVVD